jgi:hypothetical protein
MTISKYKRQSAKLLSSLPDPRADRRALERKKARKARNA